MRRMFTLVSRCVEAAEPVLLVGETGCGKTTVCQLLALLRRQRLRIINCHQHTETSDFVGGFRPARGAERAGGAPFVWEDGPLLQARARACPPRRARCGWQGGAGTKQMRPDRTPARALTHKHICGFFFGALLPGRAVAPPPAARPPTQCRHPPERRACARAACFWWTSCRWRRTACWSG